MSSKPKMSIVIPTKNRCKALDICLNSLTEQTFKNFEVIVVDGGSLDDTKNIVNKYSRKLSIIFTIKKNGLISQMNKGWKIAGGDIIVRTDDDVIASSNWLKEIIKTFNKSKDIGGVTGPTIISERQKKYRDLFYFQEKLNNGNLIWRLIGKIYFNYFLEGKAFVVSKWFKSGAFSLGSNYVECLKLKEPIEVDYQEACNMATRKGLLEEIGGFDETFVGIGEFSEPDVSFKIKKIGYKIMFNPKAIVYHLPSKEGFFQDRPRSYGRILNFINFYFQHIRPNTIDKFTRFFSYLIFLNGFFVYKFITTRQINQLGCILGTIVGLGKNLFKTNNWRDVND